MKITMLHTGLHVRRKTLSEVQHMVQQYQRQIPFCKPEGAKVLSATIARLSRLVKGGDRHAE